MLGEPPDGSALHLIHSLTNPKQTVKGTSRSSINTEPAGTDSLMSNEQNAWSLSYIEREEIICGIFMDGSLILSFNF